MTDRRNLNTALISSLVLHFLILLLFIFLVQGGDVPKANHPITVTLITEEPPVIEEPVEVIETTKPVEAVETPAKPEPVEVPVETVPETPSETAAVAPVETAATPIASVDKPAVTETPSVTDTYPSNYDFGFEDSSAAEDAPVVVTPLGFDDASVSNTNTDVPANDFFNNADEAVFTDTADPLSSVDTVDSGFDSTVISDLSNKDAIDSSNTTVVNSNNTSNSTNTNSSNRQFQFVDGKSDRILISYTPARMPAGLILDVPSVSVTYEFVILKDGSTSDLQLIGQTGYSSINSAVAESIRSMVFVAANSSDKRRVTYRILVEGNGN